MSVTMIPSVVTPLASAGTDLLTVAAGTQAMLAALTLSNEHSASVTVAIHIIPSGGVVLAANRMVKALSLASGESVDIALYSKCLTAGCKLHLVPSVDAVVNATLSGGIETL